MKKRIVATTSNCFGSERFLGIPLEVIEHPFEISSSPMLIDPNEYYLCVAPNGELVVVAEEDDGSLFTSAFNSP